MREMLEGLYNTLTKERLFLKQTTSYRQHRDELDEVDGKDILAQRSNMGLWLCAVAHDCHQDVLARSQVRSYSLPLDTMEFSTD